MKRKMNERRRRKKDRRIFKKKLQIRCFSKTKENPGISHRKKKIRKFSKKSDMLTCENPFWQLPVSAPQKEIFTKKFCNFIFMKENMYL